MQLLDLQRSMFRIKAEQIPIEREICLFEDNVDMGLAREMVNLILDKGTEICGIFCRKSEAEYRFVISSKNQNMQELGKCLYQILKGKGGGKPDMVQGTILGNKEEIQTAFQESVKKIRREE